MSYVNPVNINNTDSYFAVLKERERSVHKQKNNKIQKKSTFAIIAVLALIQE
jgi:hypothetical protein